MPAKQTDGKRRRRVRRNKNRKITQTDRDRQIGTDRLEKKRQIETHKGNIKRERHTHIHTHTHTHTKGGKTDR